MMKSLSILRNDMFKPFISPSTHLCTLLANNLSRPLGSLADSGPLDTLDLPGACKARAPHPPPSPIDDLMQHLRTSEHADEDDGAEGVEGVSLRWGEELEDRVGELTVSLCAVFDPGAVSKVNKSMREEGSAMYRSQSFVGRERGRLTSTQRSHSH